MKKRVITILLILAMTVSLFAGLSLTASAGSVAAVDPTGYTSAEDVKYVTAGGYRCNWGARGEDCTFLTTYAQKYYTGSYTYDSLCGLQGGTQSTASSSPLYTALKNMMNNKSTHTTSYKETNDLYKYTDCLKSDYAHISSFYSGKQLNGTWDSGSTWNKEHTWPNSKIDNNGENDIMMLRPTAVSENSGRGNDAYGESSGYYFPNSESNGKYDLRGDCARIVLYVYTRWGVTATMWGSSGVMENVNILLKWMEEDPVDTWEMGRNDACESILGVRNAFVDYPEFGFLLFNQPVPNGYTSPSSQQPVSSYTVTAVSSDLSMGTVSVTGRTVTATPKAGYYVAGYELSPAGAAKVTQSGNTFTLSGLTADCTLTVKFAAKTAVTVTFSCPADVSCASVSGYAGDAIKLTKPTGTPTGKYDYTFKGWVEKPVDNSETKPAPIYAAGDSFTPKANTTLYALYTYTIGGTGGSSTTFTRISSVDDMIDGASYVIVSSVTGKAMSSNVASNWINPGGTYSGDTIEEPKATDIWTITDGVISCEAGSLTSSGAKNISLSASGTKWSFTVASGAWSIASGNNILSFNSSGWRPYSGGYGNDTAFFLYMGGAGGTTYYTTIIGEPLPCEHTNTELRDAKEPTCLEPGYTGDLFCADCNELLEQGEMIEALSHDYEAEVTAPTCLEGGYTTYICSRCGDEYTADETAPLGHDYEAEVTAPTCLEGGFTTYICSRCGDEYTADETEPLGHDYVDGICSRCGEEDPNYDPPVPADPCEGYTDIDRSAWYHPFADFVIEKGLMGSTTSGLTFEPATSCTRSMIVTILYSLAGKPEVEFEPVFPDVKDNQWYTAPVMWAYQNGVVSGYDNGNFGTNDKITREQMAVVLKAYTEKIEEKDTSKTADLSSFADASKVTWSKPYIEWAVAEGLLSGKADGDKTYLDPQGYASRAEVAAILTSYIQSILK